MVVLMLRQTCSRRFLYNHLHRGDIGLSVIQGTVDETERGTKWGGQKHEN